MLLLPQIKSILSKDFSFILASNSPRRKDILKELDIPFKITPFTGKEIESKIFSKSLVKQNALLKTNIKASKNSIIIACDTIVVYNKNAFGKPKTAKECRKFLKTLSGKSHQVISGLAVKVKDTNTEKTFVSTATTTVIFEDLTKDLIDWYIKTGEWSDKAGGYAIQGKGKVLVKSIKGSYSNVIGLPIGVLQKILAKVERGL